MPDFRVYVYNGSAGLEKPPWGRRYHNATSIQHAREHIADLRKRPMTKNHWCSSQFLIIEYTGNYRSRIAELVQPIDHEHSSN